MKDQRQPVAIVDDHDSFRHTAAGLLTLLRYRVALEAPNGMVFLRAHETCTPLPDFCLLDNEMPIMDGIVTARLLRERYPRIKIVA